MVKIIVDLRRAQKPCVQICAVPQGPDGWFTRAAGLLYAVPQYTTCLLSIHRTIYIADVSQSSGRCLPSIQYSVYRSGGPGQTTCVGSGKPHRSTSKTVAPSSFQQSFCIPGFERSARERKGNQNACRSCSLNPPSCNAVL